MGINRKRMAAGRPLCVLVLAFLVAATLAASETDVAATGTRAAEASIGAKMWRVRSMDKVPLEGWVLTQIKFFEAQDGTGDPVDCEAIASTYKGMSDVPAPTEYEPKNAMDGTTDTKWESEDGGAGQWIGVSCPDSKDIQSVAMQTPDNVMGPSAVVVEKSQTGQGPWGLVAEIPAMKKWGEKLELYKLVPRDQMPKSVFSIRSQQEPMLCIGVRTRLKDPNDEESPKILIEDGAIVELQNCDDDVTTQFWSFDANSGHLHSAADEIYILHISEDQLDADGKPEAGAMLTIGECKDGCPDKKQDEFVYSDSVVGGFMRSRIYDRANLVMNPAEIAPDGLKAGAEVKLSACGPEGNMPASLENDDCKSADEGKYGRWELPPLFNLEEARRAIKCSPYSHSLIEPEQASSRQQAQRACAKDIKCSAYNWAKADAGEDRDTLYLCQKLHNVYTGAAEEGWELGIRAGRAYASPYDKLMHDKAQAQAKAA